MRPNLDHWLADPTLRVAHRRETNASVDALWAAAQGVRVRDVRTLGRVIRWRIPGVTAQITFDELFSSPPFTALESSDGALVSGLVGRIWTPRRDYPMVADGNEFRRWSTRGTVRVLFANWVEPTRGGGATLSSEVRVKAFDLEGRLGLAAVRPLVAAFQHLIGSEALEAAVGRV
jgi:hypothetical protein